DPAGQRPARAVRTGRLRPPRAAPGVGVLPARRPAPAAAPTGPQPVAPGARVPAGGVRRGPAGRSGAGVAGGDRLLSTERVALRAAPAAPHQDPVPRRHRARRPPTGPARRAALVR